MSDTGILVTAYSRPRLLRLVLESLERQNALDHVNVWIDGTSGRRELTSQHKKCMEICAEYPVREVRTHAGHLGIEKLMIDALSHMMAQYEQIIILEDDCFPTCAAIEEFKWALDKASLDETIFSVYGHHFLVPDEMPKFSRFQGWGWATTTKKLRPIHEEISRLFSLSEKDYLEYVRTILTPEIALRLDKTPPRNVLHVLSRFFSWDSCVALTTAAKGLEHMPTRRRVIYNCGLSVGHGHFKPNEEFRKPPFNMITPGEVWSVFDS